MPYGAVWFYDQVQSNAGGGGERVLWTAIAAMQRTNPDIISAVYSGDTDATKAEIISKVKVGLAWLIFYVLLTSCAMVYFPVHRLGLTYH